ncbi:MAG: Holliday junction resolvase, partial [Candidatus Bathyarchaeia archaeon]
MTRGIQDERNLARLLWKRGFAVMRAPASGASTKMPRPDLV